MNVNELFKHVKKTSRKESKRHGLMKGHHYDTNVPIHAAVKECKRVGIVTDFHAVGVVDSHGIRHGQGENVQVGPKI